MKTALSPWLISWLILLAGVAPSTTKAAEPSSDLELAARDIFSSGPNEWDGEVLEITKGRGSNIGWYASAREAGEVEVVAEFSNEAPLNQSYQLSFDGADTFWDVPVTGAKKWDEAVLGTFSVRADVPMLVVLVPPSNRKYDHPVRFRKLTLRGEKPGNLSFEPPLPTPPTPASKPGFGEQLKALHPSLSALDLRPDDAVWRVTGMAVRDGGGLLFTTWDGDLFELDLDADLDGAAEGEAMPVRRLARGLSEPMGLAVQGDRIFVTEKNQLTELIDEDGDGTIETYRCVTHDWPSTMDYHEYFFGAVAKGSRLYGASSVAMGYRNDDNRQAPMRGSALEIDLDSGETKVVAGGLRTPNGVGAGPGGSVLYTDNQGEWLPASKLIRLELEAFYHFRSRPPWHPFDRPDPTPPAVWLPHGEISASPTQPILLPESWGPYAGHVLYGDATFGGLQRVFLEEVDGVTQGGVFRFSQGFRHLFNRFALTEDGTLFGGGVARGKDWDFIERVSGLTRVRFSDRKVFEMRAVRARSNGLEIEFTRPLAEGAGWDPAGYYVTQWGYQPTQVYGGAKVRHRRSEVRSATVSPDRDRVFLELPDLVENEVVHLRLPDTLESGDGSALWSGEAWYTLNRIPEGNPGDVRSRPDAVSETTALYFDFGGDDAGRTLYQNFCAACHSIDGTSLVGPGFRGMLGAKRRVVDAETGETREVKADAAYVHESIVEPNSFVVEGYENIMPPLGAALGEDQIEAIVEYVVRVSAPN
ncbi:MAG: cytochrome c [Verrucomicrobiales bacterium]